MIYAKMSQNEGFQRFFFFEFGWLDWPDIADSHRQSRYPASNNVQGAGNCHDLCIISIIKKK